ncbi:MAG: hypothetical protein KKH98_03770 [Spirochaetes bacterium]|nr:hypothetical protein [Spirochaetota bacterium]
MTKENKRLWGIERLSDTPERIVFIYEAIKKLVDDGKLPENFSIIDIAGGRGVVLNGIVGLFPCKATILDIKYHPEWGYLKYRIKRIVMPLQDYIEDDHPHDIVMMLNSYRNWKKSKIIIERKKSREQFDEWLPKNAKYFITSGASLPYERGEIRGHDFKSNLQLYKLPLIKNL